MQLYGGDVSGRRTSKGRGPVAETCGKFKKEEVRRPEAVTSTVKEGQMSGMGYPRIASLWALLAMRRIVSETGSP